LTDVHGRDNKLVAGKRIVRLADTIPMSTYLVAFVVGHLETTEPVMVGTTPVRVRYVPGKKHLAHFGQEIAVASLSYFEEYYGRKYPSDKLDLIAIPDFAAPAKNPLRRYNTWVHSLAATERLSPPMSIPGPSAKSLTAPSPWELAAETIAVKIRWFGLLVGYVIVNISEHPSPRYAVLNALLTLGAFYTLLDTLFSIRGRIFLGRLPLVISVMEAVFIALLCYYDGGLESPFRYFYFLSLICCAVRHPSRVTYATCALHGISYGMLFIALPAAQRSGPALVLMLVMLGWVTWASNALALLLKRVGDYLGSLNLALQRNQAELEQRIAERTAELQESQAHVLHQEKMAAFGLLAAGIAHEVGNPLTSISSMVQILQKSESDAYTLNKLALVSGQLKRIQTTLRELIEFSRPASSQRVRVALGDILDEALNIAKYYKRTSGRIAPPELPPDLPPLYGVRDQLVQVFLNLILNAIDAVDRDGRIELSVRRCPGAVEVAVRDNGPGIRPEHGNRLFQPYFTTKKHGTGLGLFVTRRLVSDHGGTVSFESQPGRGTTFLVNLPVGDTAEPARPVMAAGEKEVLTW
jgi:signal transduction histidine kinase